MHTILCRRGSVWRVLVGANVLTGIVTVFCVHEAECENAGGAQCVSGGPG